MCDHSIRLPAVMIELIDTLDASGNPTGKTKEKTSVHRDGDWHRAAHIWIVTDSGFVLLQRRSFAKENFPGLWDVSAAGHLSSGESSLEAAVRETREELGLELSPAELTPIATTTEEWRLNDGTYLDKEIHDVFLVRREVRPDVLELQVGEVDRAILIHIDTFRRHVENRDPSLVPHWEEYDLLLNVLDNQA